MFEFKEIIAGVLSTLGIKSFAKDEKGISILTKEQEAQLTEKWGDKFVRSFSEQLASSQAEKGALADTEVQVALAGLKAKNKENAAEMASMREQLAQAKAREEQLKVEKAEHEATIAKLSKDAVKGDGTKVEEKNQGNMTKKGFKADMSLAYNKFYADKYYGRVTGEYAGSNTVDTANLQTEFGKYVTDDRLDVIQRMLIKTDSTSHMTTLITNKTEVRASTDVITSVLQSFVPKWTPKGKTTFTPLTIKNFKCKINVPITPSDIMESVFGYLYDENLTPEQMPIVKYILYQLVFPKLDEEREYALATGVYKENAATKDGDNAGDATNAMDGYITILCRELLKDKTAVNFLPNTDAITDKNVIAKVQALCDLFKPVYKKSDMPIFVDPDLLTLYKKARRAQYPNLQLSDDDVVKIEDRNAHFEELEGMRGTGCFFSTTSDNFKHLMSQDPQNVKINMQVENYDVKIFGEYWEGTGFWLADAIFAFVSSDQVTKYKTAAGIVANAAKATGE